MTVDGGTVVEAPVPAGAGATVVAAPVAVEEALTVLEERTIVDEVDASEEDEEVTEVLEVTGATLVTELEVEAVPVACEALERMLVASSGVRVVVTVAAVAKTDGSTVTVTVTGPVAVMVVVVAVEVAVSVLVPVLVAVPVVSPPAGSVEFPPSPRIPPVAPLASMTERALASVVQARRTPSSRMEGIAKQLSDREHLPRTVSHLLPTQRAIASSMQAESPAMSASRQLLDWNNDRER
jgi:hypothetical protein